MIDAGIYKARAIAGSEQYTTSSRGTDTIAIDLEVPALGRNLQTYLYLSPAAIQYAVEKLRAMGWEGEDILNLKGIDKNEVNINVKYETHDGEQKLKVEVMAGAGRATFTPLDQSAKRDFAARVSALMGKTTSNTGTDFKYGANAPSSKAGL